MNLKQIRPDSIALLVAGLFVLATGAYTENGGFQFAGLILLLVGGLLAFNQARQGDDPGE